MKKGVIGDSSSDEESNRPNPSKEIKKQVKEVEPKKEIVKPEPKKEIGKAEPKKEIAKHTEKAEARVESVKEKIDPPIKTVSFLLKLINKKLDFLYSLNIK